MVNIDFILLQVEHLLAEAILAEAILAEAILAVIRMRMTGVLV